MYVHKSHIHKTSTKRIKTTTDTQEINKRHTMTIKRHKKTTKRLKAHIHTVTLVFICFLPCSHMEGCLLHACAYSGKVFHLWAGVKFTAELKVNITLCSRKQVHLSLHVLHHRPRRKPVGNLEEKSMATASTSKSES